jgi:hypothetical protein
MNDSPSWNSERRRVRAGKLLIQFQQMQPPAILSASAGIYL